jgi:hypothetical protein
MRTIAIEESVASLHDGNSTQGLRPELLSRAGKGFLQAAKGFPVSLGRDELIASKITSVLPQAEQNRATQSRKAGLSPNLVGMYPR